MFDPPTPVASEVFATLPAKYRKPRRTAWADANHSGAELDCYIEGPAFDGNGNLYFVDIPFGRIFRASPAGEVDLVAEYDGEPNGLKVGRDGRILVADYRNGILVLDPATGNVRPLVDRFRSESFKGVNDLFLADDGTLYFTDQGQTGLHDPTGRVFRLTPEGKLELFLGGIPSPNGLSLNPDGTALYVAVTRANAIWRAPILADGTTTKVGLFIQLSGGIGPDGIAVDEEGGIVVAHVGLGVTWRFDAMGRPTHRIDAVVGHRPTNMAFGGPDRRTLFMTESTTGSILTARLPVAGRQTRSR